MGCALLKDFTLENMIIHAVLDAQMNQTLPHITMSVTVCTTYLLLSGDMLQYCHRETIFPRLGHPSVPAESLIWNRGNGLPWRLLFVPISSTAKVPRILAILVIAWKERFALWRSSLLPTPTSQTTCLAQHLPGVPHHNFRLPKVNARYPYLPNARSTTRERGNDYRGWAIYTDGGTRVVDRETHAGWGVVARSRHGRIDIMFGPVVTTEAHLAFSGARAHSNNTAEMTAMIEALSFLGPHGPLALDEQSCIYYDSLHAAGLCLGRSRLVHMCSWYSLVNGPWCSLNANFGSPCNTCMVTVEIWVMNVLTMPLHLGPSDLPQATTLPLVGFIITLIAFACFDGCHNITEILERLQRVRTDVVSLSQVRN